MKTRFKITRESETTFCVFDTRSAVYVFSGSEAEATEDAARRNA